jgi:hypothetical protein
MIRLLSPHAQALLPQAQQQGSPLRKHFNTRSRHESQLLQAQGIPRPGAQAQDRCRESGPEVSESFTPIVMLPRAHARMVTQAAQALYDRAHRSKFRRHLESTSLNSPYPQGRGFSFINNQISVFRLKKRRDGERDSGIHVSHFSAFSSVLGTKKQKEWLRNSHNAGLFWIII